MSVVTPQSASLVDTISLGYQAINRRPWVAAVPAGLSAYLWLDPPPALAELLGALRGAINSITHIISGEGPAQAPLVQQLLLSGARLMIGWLNLVPIQVPIGLEVATTTDSIPRMALAGLLVNGTMLLISGLFLTLLGSAVGNERLDPLNILRRSLRLAWQITLYLLAVLGVVLLMGLPFLAISAIVIATLPAAVVPVLAAWYVALFWAYVYTGFAPEAILLTRVGPLRAIYHSVNVVRRNLVGTLGLLLISFLIASGLGVLWHQLANSPSGVAAAILGSAYVGSGLSAARLLFYRERHARWRQP